MALQPNDKTLFGCLVVVTRAGGTPTVNATAIYALYAGSLAWVAGLAAFLCGALTVVNVLIGLVHCDPRTSPAETIGSIFLFPPMFGGIAAFWAVIVFALPQCFQAVVSGALVRRAVINWYCFDDLTPTEVPWGIDAGPDWQPYQHGLTVSR